MHYVVAFRRMNVLSGYVEPPSSLQRASTAAETGQKVQFSTDLDGCCTPVFDNPIVSLLEWTCKRLLKVKQVYLVALSR